MTARKGVFGYLINPDGIRKMYLEKIEGEKVSNCNPWTIQQCIDCDRLWVYVLAIEEEKRENAQRHRS